MSDFVVILVKQVKINKTNLTMKKLVRESLNESVKLTEDDLEFIDYVCSFYAYNGPEGKGFYSDHFNDKLSCQMVKDAVIKWKKHVKKPLESREQLKSYMWSLYPDIVDGESEYSF